MRKVVSTELSKAKFWHFDEKNLSKEEIKFILENASKATNLEGIVFFENNQFDKDCSNWYFDCLVQNKSIIGIDLYSLKIPINVKKDFLSLFNTKSNLKYIVFDSKEISKEEALSLSKAYNMKLETNFDSDYYDYYCGHSTYYFKNEKWQSKIWLFSRK